jgi:hypothetical protein
MVFPIYYASSKQFALLLKLAYAVVAETVAIFVKNIESKTNITFLYSEKIFAILFEMWRDFFS